jgi:hypothetical protein
MTHKEEEKKSQLLEEDKKKEKEISKDSTKITTPSIGAENKLHKQESAKSGDHGVKM